MPVSNICLSSETELIALESDSCQRPPQPLIELPLLSIRKDNLLLTMLLKMLPDPNVSLLWESDPPGKKEKKKTITQSYFNESHSKQYLLPF